MNPSRRAGTARYTVALSCGLSGTMTAANDQRFPRLGSMTCEEFKRHLAVCAADVPCDERILRGEESPLAAPLKFGPLTVGNRWVVHPMEGWDGTAEGGPGELTLRRWQHFGESGAKLIWGGEAVAVRYDGRANPHQLVCVEATEAGLARLRNTLIGAHSTRFGGTDGLVVGLQLTHSGRFARPNEKTKPEPRVAYRHPILDRRVGIASDDAVLSDAEVDDLIGDFAAAAKRAEEIGFSFVDIKHCHGYLLHEFLGAHTRPGRYGGSFENRTRLLRELIAAVRREAPSLEVCIRVSIFDMVPFRPDPALSEGKRLGPGIPEDVSHCLPYRYGFGVDQQDPSQPDLSEGRRLLALLGELGVQLVSLSAGSPYYNPHMQRPALYPPSDGYQPPEDPLVGVARHLCAVRDLKRDFPNLMMVGTALSYLQDYLPHVAQAIVRNGWMDAVGLGRMILSYWDLPADTLERGELKRKRVCRTFSDCTTAPRNGLVSGCYPLDSDYAGLPEAKELRAIKSGRSRG